MITGAGRAPARALALALAGQGVGLALCDLTPMALEETARQARSLGAQVTTHVSDPSKGLAARMLVDEVVEAWSGLDFLVLYPGAEPRQGLLELDEWDWQRTLESNLNAPFLLMQTTARWMRSEGRGGVFISLISPATQPEFSGGVAFRASQAGLRALTGAAAAELAGDGIRVYGFAPKEWTPTVLEQIAVLGVGLCRGDALADAGSIFEFS